MKHFILGGLLSALSLSAVADEGMWVLHNIDPRTQTAMQQLGLQLTPQQLYDRQSGTSLKDAVVDFGDFCSGVVVSPNGLVFTNHHCGFGAIQALSTTDDDILKNGFVAHSFAEERPAEGLSVFFLQFTDDVTPRVTALCDSIKAESQTTSLQDMQSVAMSKVQAEYEASHPGREVRVQSFYGASQFFVSVYKEYTDIRLVFTPTSSLGNFGGDTDNWMWPRQTCDFSVFRIYADKNGEPTPYSKDNVPLQPKRWAKICTDGYRLGDYCMTIGYPGSTSRYLSSYGITQTMESSNKPRIDVRGKKQEVWKRWMKADRSIGIKYASKFAHSSNYWKNSIGMNQALTNLGVVAQKQKLEQRIAAWVEQSEDRKACFGEMLTTLDRLYTDNERTMRAAYLLSETRGGIEIITAARLAEEYTLCTDSASAALALDKLEEFYKDYDARVDEETTAVLLQNLAEKADTAYRPDIIDTIQQKFNGDCRAYARDLFSRSMLAKQNPLRELALNEKALKNDPALALKVEMEIAMGTCRMQLAQTMPTVQLNENLLTQAFLEMEQQQPHYSDANFSMRLSYGIIQDYTASGQHFNHYTTSESILKKAAMKEENDDYLLEDGIMKLFASKNFGRYADKQTNDLQLCFLSNNDITGGNSGSPMFNGRGELIGLAFDGNWEAMSGDISFDPALQRCIGVDIRFVLYLIDKWGHADNLIRELGI
ncbi:MAG: S46 family peptidase [Bacteroidales bacterium]|nr:S46 family peptidase [Candidatus Physcousia equi]